MPGQPQGYINQPPPAKNSNFLIIALSGLALLVILVPLVLPHRTIRVGHGNPGISQRHI
jgi:hypothetical protein